MSDTPDLYRRGLLKAAAAASTAFIVTPQAMATPSKDSDVDGLSEGQIRMFMRAGKFSELTTDLVANVDELVATAKNKLGNTPLGEVIILVENARRSGANINASKDMEYSDKQYPQIHQDNGKTFVIISRQMHQWTSKYASEFMLPTNAAIQSAVDKGYLVESTKSGLSDEVLESYKETAEKMMQASGAQLKEVPAIYINTRRTHVSDNVPNAHPQQTKEGKQMMLINPLFLGLDSKVQKSILAHELAHLALKHTSPESLAIIQNKGLDALQQMELDADRLAATTTCNRDLLSGVSTVLDMGSSSENTLAFTGAGQDLMHRRNRVLQGLVLPEECKVR